MTVSTRRAPAVRLSAVLLLLVAGTGLLTCSQAFAQTLLDPARSPAHPHPQAAGIFPLPPGSEAGGQHDQLRPESRGHRSRVVRPDHPGEFTRHRLAGPAARLPDGRRPGGGRFPDLQWSRRTHDAERDLPHPGKGSQPHVEYLWQLRRPHRARRTQRHQRQDRSGTPPARTTSARRCCGSCA